MFTCTVTECTWNCMNMHISNLVSRVRALKQLLLQILKLGFEVPDLMTQAMSLLLKLCLRGGRGGGKTKLYRLRERRREAQREGRKGRGERERERNCFGVWKYIHCTCTCIMHYRLHVHVAYSHCLLRILKLLIIYEHFISFKCHLRCVYTWSFSSLIFSYKNRILHAPLIWSFTCTHSYPYNAITCTMYMYMYVQ